MVIVLIFVQGIPPFHKLIVYTLGHAIVGPEDVEQPLGIVLVQLHYRVALLVGGLGIIPVVTYHVG